MVLAFKLYGDFHWPPTPKPAPDPNTRPGTIEVHFAQRGGTDFHAFLRWIPQGTPKTGVAIPQENIHGLADAAQWFVARQDEVASLWIDDEQPAKDVPKVAFRGAFLIDQFDPPSDDDSKPNLRLPLVRACSYRTGKTVYSELVVDRNSGNSTFRFNLHLPLPVRRTTLAGPRHLNPASFPFCVVYATRRPAAEILDFTALVGGWIGADDRPGSFLFDRRRLPGRRRLGHFGFAALSKGAGRELAAYEGNRYPDGSSVEPFDFWPRSSEAFVHDVLSRSGFAVPPSKAWLKMAPASATDLSLRFRAEAGGKGELIYRMRVVAAPDPDKPENEDIRSFGGLALRLVPETGGWLRTAEAVHVECALSWEIPNDVIFRDRARDWTAFATVKLLWDERIEPGFAAPPQDDGILFAGTLAQAAHSLSAARKALQATEGGQPQSFLPDLVTKTRQTVRFGLYARPFRARFLKDSNVIAWGRAERSGKTRPVFLRPRMWLSLASEADLVTGYAFIELTDAIEAFDLRTALAETLGEVMEAGGITDATLADSGAQAENIWHIRHSVTEANLKAGTAVSHDTSVPVSRVPEFVAGVEDGIRTRFPDAKSYFVGHIGDGNIHAIAIFPREKFSDPLRFAELAGEVNALVDEITVSLGGSVSAEHGIGRSNRARLQRHKDPVELEFMRQIKRIFDPVGLMNPGVLL